jgi:glyoxylase-like metal-dependent hydrolase (beta-lactamase superfamily II)
LSLAAEAELLAGTGPAPQSGDVDLVAPDVYFILSDKPDDICNNGWVIFDDYVLVIDANFPDGARQVISKIRSMTDKPIRFALDTHHHPDHAYGNQVFVENGAVPFAHTGVIDEMKRFETGYYDGKPGAWEAMAKDRPDVRASKLKPPSVLFSGELIFDDGKHRVEVLHLGVAHTHGDSLAWLPKEKILFAGDVCVNGPYNNVLDGDVSKWVDTLEAARRLDAQIVLTGHGPRSLGTLLDDQQAFFKALREQVAALVALKAPAETKPHIERIRASLKENPRIARFVGDPGAGWDPLPSQVAKVYGEMTGNKLAVLMHEQKLARIVHARSHGLAQS